jgi:hypothetical protein
VANTSAIEEAMLEWLNKLVTNVEVERAIGARNVAGTHSWDAYLSYVLYVP